MPQSGNPWPCLELFSLVLFFKHVAAIKFTWTKIFHEIANCLSHFRHPIACQCSIVIKVMVHAICKSFHPLHQLWWTLLAILKAQIFVLHQCLDFPKLAAWEKNKHLFTTLAQFLWQLNPKESLESIRIMSSLSYAWHMADTSGCSSTQTGPYYGNKSFYFGIRR